MNASLEFGDAVWVLRGGSEPPGQPGCTRQVCGTIVGRAEAGTDWLVRLDEDDPYDTVGWHEAGQVGNWSASCVRRRHAGTNKRNGPTGTEAEVDSQVREVRQP